MSMLAERVDGVIGVDTHRDTLTAAAVTAVGGLLGQITVAADGSATGGCWSSPAPMFPAAAALRSRVRAAMARG
jgi:hypothetical protein